MSHAMNGLEKLTECDILRGLRGGGVSSIESLTVEVEARDGEVGLRVRALRGLAVLGLLVG